MKVRHLVVPHLIGLFLCAALPLIAKDGKLVVRANPRQAYVFIDGMARKEGGGSFKLSPGEHTLDVRHYGYRIFSRKVTVNSGKATRLAVELEPLPGEVQGPWARIQLKGAKHAIVLLNGKSLDHFVGHVGEFNNQKRELLVPPGTHQISVLRPGDNREIYSGSFTVQPNEQAILNLNRGGEPPKARWDRGEALKSLPRFSAQRGYVTVAVEPVTASLSAGAAKVDCGGTADLSWTTTGAGGAEISGLGAVPPSGQRSFRPVDTTAYTLTASGPGGHAERTATITVVKEISGSLQVSPPEAHYKRKGSEVEQDTVTLSWTTFNVEHVSINGEGSVNASRIGSIDATGRSTFAAMPERTDPGPIDENWTFRLTATNACGGSMTRTATLHLVGSIEAPKSPEESTLENSLAATSIYFPTALPTVRDPNGGLLAGQQRLLAEVASNFKRYAELRPEAHLTLQGHADQRGDAALNQALSARRVVRVKIFLLEQGIPANKMETAAFGKDRNLDPETVRSLEENDPSLSKEQLQKILRDLDRVRLASNRRVDILLSTVRPRPAKPLPYTSEDAKELLGKERRPARPANTHR